MIDEKFLAEKLLQCYNIYVVKYREKCYKIIENQPDQATKIKDNMILHNIYALRMNVDIGFKKYMMKLLYEKINKSLTKESIKKLLISIIDELEQPIEKFFNIFENEPKQKLGLNTELIINNLNELMTNFPNLSDFSKNDINFLKNLLDRTEKDTALYRAIEDLIQEYTTGIEYSRYYKPGEEERFLLFHFNKYLILLLEYRMENKLPIYTNDTFLLFLIPEYYLNSIKISELLFEALNDLFNISSKISINSISLSLDIHFMSVLMALIFDDFDYNDKIQMLNKYYDFSLDPEEVIKISDCLDKFLELSILESKTSLEKKIIKSKKNTYLKEHMCFSRWNSIHIQY